ncbi:MAG: type I restriction endonuclease [Phycisphaerales bacterium]
MLERISALADRLDLVRSDTLTEEATKTALVLPFIRELGYDIFNPSEVVPEFTADVGIKKGEKVDYAVFQNGAPIILFECKPCGAKLDSYSSQLYRYFSVTKARIAILTDGIEYRFFSDLSEPNKLDAAPFFVLSLDKLNKDAAERLSQFSKDKFDLEVVLADAECMRIKNAVRAHFVREMTEPSDEFVRHFAEPLHNGQMRQTVIDRFRPIVRSAILDHIGLSVETRLQAALRSNRGEDDHAVELEAISAESKSGENEADETGVVTTVEELNGFYIVKAILRELVPASRITARDVKTYFGILLDDNNRKPVCRLWFNRSQKYLGVFDANKKEERIPIEQVDDLFQHADRIRQSLSHVLPANAES